MPIYEYRCQKCQHEMEIIQKMSDEALTTCPDCGKEGLTKLISRSSFQLKGTGWYQSDFKNPPKKETAAKPVPAATAAATTAAPTASSPAPAAASTATTSTSTTEAA